VLGIGEVAGNCKRTRPLLEDGGPLNSGLSERLSDDLRDMTVDACPRPGILAEPSDRAGKRCQRWRRSSTGSTVERRKVGHVGASTSCGDHPPHTQ
jgi:hypothetical protein